MDYPAPAGKCGAKGVLTCAHYNSNGGVHWADSEAFSTFSIDSGFFYGRIAPNESLEISSGMGKDYNREHPQYCARRRRVAHELSTPKTLPSFEMNHYRRAATLAPGSPIRYDSPRGFDSSGPRPQGLNLY